MKLKDKTEIMIHGHRGSRGTHAENTLVSFAEACDAKADFIELDVHLTKDSQLVVFHDFELEGVYLGELTLEQIKAKNAAIPSLKEVIDWKLAQAPRIALNVEIKRDDPKKSTTPLAKDLAESVVTLLDQARLLESSLVQSFDFEVVRALRKLSSQVKLSSLFEKKADFAQQAINNHSQVAAPLFSLLSAENVQRARSLGVEILPWTVNKTQDWDRLVDMGVRGIITDFPRRLAAHLLSK